MLIVNHTRNLFQSTPLMRGETLNAHGYKLDTDISIHSPHARGDFNQLYGIARQFHFNPLPSCEGRLDAYCPAIIAVIISIHSPHARGDDTDIKHARRSIISIHSPHARGDKCSEYQIVESEDFNPLPSCEGRQRATPIPMGFPVDFNPLPSCEGRPNGRVFIKLIKISIHSPHARGDDLAKGT